MNAELQLLSYKSKQTLFAELIREKIIDGEFKKHDRLLPDLELARKYNLNARTVAAGLNTLVKEGLLERSPRRGTVVKAKLKEKTSNAVGMIMLGKGEVYGDIYRHISQGLIEKGLYPVLIDERTVLDYSRIAPFLSSLVSEQKRPYGLIVDGDLLVPYDFIREKSKNFDKIVFTIKCHYPEKIPNAKYALVDFAETGRMAAQYFIDKGFKKLACLSIYEADYAGPWSSMQVMIMQSFAETCRQSGVAFDEEIFWKLLRGAPVAETVKKYLSGKKRPDAFFCFSDAYISQSILPVIKELGLGYPGDIDFIGFYDTRQSRESCFSTFNICEKKIAEATVKLLTGETDEQEMLIKPELIVRKGLSV